MNKSKFILRLDYQNHSIYDYGMLYFLHNNLVQSN